MPPSAGRSGGWCGGGGGPGAGGNSGGRPVCGADSADDPQSTFRGDPGPAPSRQGLTVNTEATMSRVCQSSRGLRVDNPEITANRRLHDTTYWSKYSTTPRRSDYWVGGGHGARKAEDLCQGREDSRVENKIFFGMRFILVGFPAELRTECRDKILHMGGKLLPSTDYDMATHIVLMGELSAGATLLWRTDGKKVVKNIWINLCCQQGRVLDERSGGVPTVYETPTKTCSIDEEQRSVVSTSKKLRRCCHDTSFNTKRVKRKILASESETSREDDDLKYSSYHHWYQCKLDSSSNTNLEQWAIDNKEKVTSLIITPGSEDGHYSLVTCNELKLYIRKAFNAVVYMNNDQMTLRGRLAGRNFLIDRSHSVRIGNVEEGSLQVYTGDTDKKDDYCGFVRMVNKELFHGKGKPDDITQWLGLVSAAKVECELLLYNFALMEDYHAAEVLMSLHDLLLDLEVTDHTAYKQVMSDLAKYKGWQKKCKHTKCFLNVTFLSKDPVTGKFLSSYGDDVPGLLKLIRNSRQHTARSYEGLFSCIVGHLVPNFMGDFQRAMSRAGYLKKLNLQYVLV